MSSSAGSLSCDVLIVGGGIAGLASAYFLDRAGMSVILVESAAALGTHSTAQNAAILRTLISDPALTAIGRNSGKLLQHPPSNFSEVPLIDRAGLLLTADRELAPEFPAWLEAAGPEPYPECRTELIDAKEAARIAPFVHHPDANDFAPGEVAAAWLPDEGHIDIAALAAGFAHGAKSARLFTSAHLVELTQDASGAATGGRLRDGRVINAAAVLFTGGAWAGKLASLAGSPLAFAPRRRHLAVTVPETTHPVDPRWPIVWNHSTAPGRSFYARPEAPGLLICACDETELEPAFAPDEATCPRDEAALEDVARTAALFLPNFETAGVHSWWAGWRTFQTSGHVAPGRFTIGADPLVPGLFWAAGLGGHGMTSSFEVGRLAAASLSAGLGKPTPAILDGPDYNGAFTPAAERLLA